LSRELSRRSVLRGTAGAVLLSSAGLLTACGGEQSGADPDSTLRIGFISPVTGAAGGFGEADAYLLKKMRETLGKGLIINRKKYSVEIVDRDSQSDPRRAGQLASELINNQKIDLMLASSTPETVNPVSDACEAARIPCLSTAVPWEVWYFGRGATPKKPFTYTYHFFIGMSDFAGAYTSLWKGELQTNKVIGVMWPNDPDGKAFRRGLEPELEKAGFTIADPGTYEDGATDYSQQIAKLKRADAEIFTTVPLPPDFITFWRQAREQGYRPKIASTAKTGQIPSQIEALGELGIGLTGGFWWTPEFPYYSTITAQTSQDLADEFEQSTGRQWNQMLGSNMALFEVAVHALQKVSDPKDRKELAAALGSTSLTTIVGPLDFRAGPMPNLSAEPLVMAQWRKTSGGRFPFQPVIVDNNASQDIPLGGRLEPLT
jgi:branched-chain amino acid transport system substrate-binding protein